MLGGSCQAIRGYIYAPFSHYIFAKRPIASTEYPGYSSKKRNPGVDRPRGQVHLAVANSGALAALGVVWRTLSVYLHLESRRLLRAAL